MRSGITQQREQLEILEKRARPTVGEQQRQRARTVTFDVHHMQTLPAVDLGAKLTQSVKPVLKIASVKAAPIFEEPSKPIGRNAKVPARPEVGREAGVGEPASEVAQRIG